MKKVDRSKLGTKLRISDYVSKGPEIEIGEITIRKLKDGSIWMEKEDGEGMSVSQGQLGEYLLKFYEENF